MPNTPAAAPTTFHPSPIGPLYAFDDFGRRAATYPSAKAAADLLGRHESAFSKAVRNKTRVCGYRWSRDPDAPFGPYVRPPRSYQDRKPTTVAAYDTAGALVGTWASVPDASEATGVPISVIREGLRCGRVRANRVWRTQDDPAPGAVPPRFSVPVSAYTDDGTLVAHYPSQLAAAEALGVRQSHVRQSLVTGCRCAGLRFRHPEPDTIHIAGAPIARDRNHPVVSYDMAGTELRRYESMSEAAQDMGLHVTSITRAVRSGSRLSAGRRWYLASEPAPGPYQAAPRIPRTEQVTIYNDRGVAVDTLTIEAAAAKYALSNREVRRLVTYVERVRDMRWRLPGHTPPGPFQPDHGTIVALDDTRQETARYATIKDAARAVSRSPFSVRLAVRTGSRCAGLFWQSV